MTGSTPFAGSTRASTWKRIGGLVAFACCVAGTACAPKGTVDRGGETAPDRASGGVGGSAGPGGMAGTPGMAGMPGGAGASGEGGTAIPGSPTAEPDAGPPLPPISCGEIMPWVADGPYVEGTKVAAGRPAHIFECRPWPNSGWCPFVTYEPAKADSPWADAWIDAGPCP